MTEISVSNGNGVRQWTTDGSDGEFEWSVVAVRRWRSVEVEANDARLDVEEARQLAAVLLEAVEYATSPDDPDLSAHLEAS